MAQSSKGLGEPSWTRNLLCIPHISMSDVTEIVQQVSKAPKRNLDKGYKFFHDAYIHDVRVKVSEEGCHIKGLSFRSMEKNEPPHKLTVTLDNGKKIVHHHCSCKSGTGMCNHKAALLFQVAHYKTLGLKAIPEIVSKTSTPQQWQVPPRTHGIKPRDLQSVQFVKPKRSPKRTADACISSSLYNPITSNFPDFSLMARLKEHLSITDPTTQLLQVLPDDFSDIALCSTVMGSVPVGSVLCSQLPKPGCDGSITKLPFAVEFPHLPLPDYRMTQLYSTALPLQQHHFLEGLQTTFPQCHEIEEVTRKQSDCPEWHKLREHRITSSTFKDVTCRKKNFETLADRLSSKRLKDIQTPAMKYGITHENDGALDYADKKNVNIRLCGFIIHPDLPFLGSSPDRIVYDPSEPSSFGCLEIKCPQKSSFRECKYLTVVDDRYALKTSHEYYQQIIGQMGLTGLQWGDFVVWTSNDMHIERIYFDINAWNIMVDKLCLFYFEHLIHKFA